MQVVMGIDPGAANLGFGIVRVEGNRMVALDGGVVETSPELPIERRLERIHGALTELIGWHEPRAMAIEDVYFGKNVRSAMAVGQASGSGAADKDQVQRMVGTLLALPEPPDSDHAADALAVAICHGGGAGQRAAIEALAG
jgi:crossover junction endodeoxyribonuclease RuvC